MFAYCENNPVNGFDPNGEWVHLAVGAIVGGIIGAAVSAVSQYKTTGSVNLGVLGVNFVSGAIAGAIASTGIGAIASTGANAALGGATYMAEQAVKGEKVTAGGVAASTLSGAIGGAIGGKGANGKELTSAWKSATAGIKREGRRANKEYAAKQIARYNATKSEVKARVSIATFRNTFASIGNSFSRWLFGN